MGWSGADVVANEDDTKRVSEACAFFRVLYDALWRDIMWVFFFFFGFWVSSQTNGAKAQTLTNGVCLLERLDINSGLGPFKDPTPISAVASPFG